MIAKTGKLNGTGPVSCSSEYDERVPITTEDEVAAAALDEVAMALAMEGSNGESQRLAGMAVKVAALSPPKRSFGSQFTDRSAYSPRSPKSPHSHSRRQRHWLQHLHQRLRSAQVHL